VTDWRNWIGRVTTATAFLDPAQANRMAVTLNRPPTMHAGDALPPAWHWLYFHDLVQTSDLGTDGHPALGLTMPPLPFDRRMWAGGSLAFEGRLRLGEHVTRTTTITAITMKRGRTGPLCFVDIEHRFTMNDEPTLLETQSIVYREPPTAADAVPAHTTAVDPQFTESWTADNTTLFRYSALTFNSHRIHYDSRYATSVEGYPDLVVQGPLLATLLMDAAARHGGPLASFDYRARSPVFSSEPFTVNGAQDGVGLRLWATAGDGRLAMEGTARVTDSSSTSKSAG